jgi:hypothetical protein
MMKKRFTDSPLEPATGKTIDAGTHIDDKSRFQMAGALLYRLDGLVNSA